MWKRKRMSTMQVPASLRQGTFGDLVETNIRLVTGEAAECVTCRRVSVDSAVWSDDLRQTVCSVLRRRDRLVVVPSPVEKREILAAGSKSISSKAVQHNHWYAKLHDKGKIMTLRFTDERELGVIAELVQKALVLGFEAEGAYWRLGNSTRYWYAKQPARTVDGFQAVPRVSFATISLSGSAVGIAFDSGFLYQTEQSVAYFFDPRVDAREQMRRQKRFDQLRSRQAGFKGTLLYDIGSAERQVCYFERFGNGETLATTGPVMNSSSLYKYCCSRHKHVNYRPNDPVAYVSFKGLSQVVPVPAKCLRLRVILDREQTPRDLRGITSAAPQVRRNNIVRIWDGCNKRALRQVGLYPQARLWRPGVSKHELLPTPELVFGKGRRVAPPAAATIKEYQRYYRERMKALKSGGLFRFEQSAGREIHLVTPPTSPTWPDTLQRAFVGDFTDCISDFTGLTFAIREVRADRVETILERLERAIGNRPLRGGKTAVVVFDDTSGDPAPYCLLSHGLVRWSLKRAKRFTLERKWQERQQAHSREAQCRAEGHWRSTIELTVLDTLLKMDATPWRLRESPYDACLAIDVGEGRRYFAMSLLICRGDDARPSYFRITQPWPKGDSDREEINPIHLREKIAWMFDQYRGSSFTPLQSLLILRDGRVCGDEPRGIAKAIDYLHKMDRLLQTACVDVVNVHKRTVKDLRMWYPTGDTYTNILEGHAVYLDDTKALVSCTGAATLQPSVTAQPCLLEGHDVANIKRVARAYFAFAQLNYSTPKKAHRDALPIHLTDEELRQKLSQDMRGIK